MRLGATLATASLALVGATGCTLVGQGEGRVCAGTKNECNGELSIKDCWSGPYDLQPDFFAAAPFRDTMQIRIQRSSDLHEVSDGLAVLVNEVSAIRPTNCTVNSDCASQSCKDGTCTAPEVDGWHSERGRRGQALEVGLPPKLLSEIAPGVPVGEPPPVSMALYLQFSCHNQNIVLYAVSGTIVFDELFSGDPNESVGAEKLTDARFDVIVADPRDANLETLEVPEDKSSPLTGNFKFHFQRGQPGQPFP